MIDNEQNRTSVVIGGASGIGLAVAQAFHAAGDDVVIADMNEQSARDAAAQLGTRARALPVDVTDEASVAEVFAQIPTPARVVNSAGTNRLGRVTEQSAEDWRAVIDICLTGAFLVIKHAARTMDDGGSIVTISSLNGKQAGEGFGAYCSAKAGLEMLTQVAALELGPRGIRVNAVAPGITETPLVAPLLAVPGIADDFNDNTPLKRHGTVEDIAAAVMFLSTSGSWITGETLAVDGGARMRRYPAVYQTLAGMFADGSNA